MEGAPGFLINLSVVALPLEIQSDLFWSGTLDREGVVKLKFPQSTDILNIIFPLKDLTMWTALLGLRLEAKDTQEAIYAFVITYHSYFCPLSPMGWVFLQKDKRIDTATARRTEEIGKGRGGNHDFLF